MTRTRYAAFTSEELIRAVSCGSAVTEMETELAGRLADLIDDNQETRTRLGDEAVHH